MIIVTHPPFAQQFNIFKSLSARVGYTYNVSLSGTFIATVVVAEFICVHWENVINCVVILVEFYKAKMYVLVKSQCSSLWTTTSSLAWHRVAIFEIGALAQTPFPLLHPCIPKTCLHILQKRIWQVLIYWLTGSTIEASCQHGLGPFLQESLQNNSQSHCRTQHDQIHHWPGASCWHWMQQSATAQQVSDMSNHEIVGSTCTST